MKRERLQYINEFLITQVNYMPILGLAFAILTITGEGNSARIACVCLSLFPFLAYVLRIRFQKMTPFFITQGLLTAVAVAGMLCVKGGIGFYLVYGVITLGHLALSIRARFFNREYKDNLMHPTVAIGILTGASFLQSYFMKDSDMSPILIVVVCYLSVYFLHLYLYNYLKFISVNEKSAGHIPKQKLFASGGYLAAAFAVISAICLGLFTNQTLGERIGQIIKQGLLMLLRGFFSLFNHAAVEEVPQPIEQEVVQNNMMEMLPEAKTPGPLADIINTIFEYMVNVLLIVIVIVTIMSIVKLIIIVFRRRRGQEAFTTQKDCMEIKEKLKRDKESNSLHSVFSSLGATAKVRKAYKKTVWGQRTVFGEDVARGVLNTATARECCYTITNEEAAGTMAGLYEKARYSNEECNATDVKVAKKQMMHMLTIKR